MNGACHLHFITKFWLEEVANPVGQLLFQKMKEYQNAGSENEAVIIAALLADKTFIDTLVYDFKKFLQYQKMVSVANIFFKANQANQGL